MRPVKNLARGLSLTSVHLLRGALHSGVAPVEPGDLPAVPGQQHGVSGFGNPRQGTGGRPRLIGSLTRNSDSVHHGRGLHRAGRRCSAERSQERSHRQRGGVPPNNGQQDIQAGVATAPEAASTTARVSARGHRRWLLKQGCTRRARPVEGPTRRPPRQTNVTSDDRKVEHGQSGGRRASPLPGWLVRWGWVSDQISSSVSKVTDGLKGGRAETGKAGADGTSK